MPIEGEWVLAGTGARSLLVAPPETRAVAVARTEEAVGKRLAEHGDELIVMSGMAEGFDHLLAVTTLRLGAPLWCMIPNRGYGRHYWGRKSLTGRDMFAEFCRIVDQAWRVTFAAESLYVGGKHSNFVRNDRMVADANEFVAWGARPGSGTEHCVHAAERASLLVEHLDRTPDGKVSPVPLGCPA